jgi:parallel beta-helix repeat protein
MIENIKKYRRKTKPLFISLFIIILFLVYSCSDSSIKFTSETKKVTTGSITGRVADASTSYAIQNATVQIICGETIAASTVTDASGTYLCTDIPAGEYVITTTFSDYVKYTATVTIINNDTKTLYIPLYPGSPFDLHAPEPPAGLSATPASTSQIYLSWTPSTDYVTVSGYYIYRGGAKIALSAVPVYYDTNLNADTKYSYTVTAYDASGNESFESKGVYAVTGSSDDTTAPSRPTELTASRPTELTAPDVSPQIELSWTASTDDTAVTGYYIYRDGVKIAYTINPSYSDTDLTSDTEYSYTVTAFDASGNESPNSDEASFKTDFLDDTTAPSVPAGFTATVVSTTHIYLSWTASTDDTDVVGYNIYRGGTKVYPTPDTPYPANTSYSDTGLVAETYYCYTVTAYDAAENESAKSEPGCATTRNIIKVPGDYAKIQKAIEAASDGDMVLVSNGKYYETIDFLGKAITVKSENGAGSTTIDGAATDGIVIFNKHETAASRLDGFTISNGSFFKGGGIYIQHSSPTITNCTITGNHFQQQYLYVKGKGGGIYIENSSSTITNCTISDNTTGGYGGGIYILNSSPTITNCTIRNNSAHNDLDSDTEGGGIYMDDSNPRITNCTITGNSTTTYYGGGGGIYTHGSSWSTVIMNCTISDNTTGGYAGGGGIYIYNSSPTITNTIVWGNTSIPDTSHEVSAYAAHGGTTEPAITYCDIGQSGPWDGGTNINIDPQFIDDTNDDITLRDYHLKKDKDGNVSPCIDAGTSTGAPTDDIDGNERPTVTGVDIGADESSGIDKDGDNYCNDYDCNDNDNTVYPGATEIYNTIDDNCDGRIDEGSVWTWGYNLYGQLGDGTNPVSSGLVHVSGINDVAAIAGGEAHTIALKKDATVWAWGDQFGTGLMTGTVPVKVTDPGDSSGFLTNVAAIATGGYHTIALKKDGTVWAWGRNNLGQLGNGESGEDKKSVVPVQVWDPLYIEASPLYLTDITAIAAGWEYTIALKRDGTVWTWGRNDYGQLGDGTITDSNVPVQVSGIDNVAAIAVGRYHTIALKKNGTVWAWGDNFFGQLGDGTNDQRNVPVQVTDPGDSSGFLTNVAAIAAGHRHTIALKKDATVWAWGLNYYSQLGGGTVTDSNVPVQVTDPSDSSGFLTNVAAIAGGGYYTIALKHDSSAWAWGDNPYGQRGDGTENQRSVPVQVTDPGDSSGFFTNVAAIAAGYGHTVVLR